MKPTIQSCICETKQKKDTFLQKILVSVREPVKHSESLPYQDYSFFIRIKPINFIRTCFKTLALDLGQYVINFPNTSKVVTLLRSSLKTSNPRHNLVDPKILCEKTER